jgi:hypothetical protein
MYQCPCGYTFPEDLGKYGCPNCEGEYTAVLINKTGGSTTMTMEGTPRRIRVHYVFRSAMGLYDNLQDYIQGLSDLIAWDKKHSFDYKDQELQKREKEFMKAQEAKLKAAKQIMAKYDETFRLIVEEFDDWYSKEDKEENKQ